MPAKFGQAQWKINVNSVDFLTILIKKSAGADGGPRLRVCARLTLRSCPHQLEGGGELRNVFLIKFLAKSGNSKHYSFFSKKIEIVVTMFAKHLQKKWSLCLPAISITHQGCACTLLGPNVEAQMFG